MTEGIAIVGMACRYPDASSPSDLWENALAQRRAFRRIPEERLCLADYFASDRARPDAIYSCEAAVIDGYEFDRARFRISTRTFQSTDLAHWLALDVAAGALADAGFADGASLPKQTTGVLVGNTLTGEFSRAGLMRLRWPYVRRTLEQELAAEGWPVEKSAQFLRGLEERYKAPFEPVTEDTLAGGLSNTIAGRICNYFDLKGGGFTLDGACASSLLAVSNACAGLITGDLDVVLAGGVDLSIDPFELVGFAKTGALAASEMTVYDTGANGFWPGEGCGFVVLMRHADAVAKDMRVYAVIRGWGVSSDGSGGMTRPEVEGQSLALGRAYRRAGFGIGGIAYFEGHGTGTPVGDAVEVRTLSEARARDGAEFPAALGSVKANIGHTKAAAGVAGLIKATMALHTRVLPPHTGCKRPLAELTDGKSTLRVLAEGEPWPGEYPLRAGVSSMGFGGINVHVVLEGASTEGRSSLTPVDVTLVSSPQDAEVFIFGERNAFALASAIDRVATYAHRLSRAELGDLSAELGRQVDAARSSGERLTARAAVVASTPAELAERLEELSRSLAAGERGLFDIDRGVFLATVPRKPRIGFLFPGQGMHVSLDGGAWSRRFERVRRLYGEASLPLDGDRTSTAVAQPAIVTASAAALQVLDDLGIRASVGLGHSLGELTALHWAGAFWTAQLVETASVRGRAMADLNGGHGAMVSIEAAADPTRSLLNGSGAVVACFNSPRQTVVSGEAGVVAELAARARTLGFRATELPVTCAFHSPLVEPAADVLAAHLERQSLQPLKRAVVSTVTGCPLAAETDLRDLLRRQVTQPVRFVEALETAARGLDLLIEVGPGHILGPLAAAITDVPVISLDAGGPSLKGLLRAMGACFVLGSPLNAGSLCAGRFTRPFDLDWSPRFFENPCETNRFLAGTRHPLLAEAPAPPPVPSTERNRADQVVPGVGVAEDASPLEVLQALVAERADLPVEALQPGLNLLKDLHLSSITVGQLVVEAARRIGVTPPAAVTDYANATIAQVAQALEDLARNGGSPAVDERSLIPAGVADWSRCFSVEWVERPLAAPTGKTAAAGEWEVLTPPGHPLAAPLTRALAEAGGGSGVVVCLPRDPDEACIDLLLRGGRRCLEGGAGTFLLVQDGGGGGAFARTLFMEAERVRVRVVDVPTDDPRAVEWVLRELGGSEPFSEARYEGDGRRLEPVLQVLPADADRDGRLPLAEADLLLVTGGGKGIAAESALALARETGVRLALFGRSDPASDPELAANLQRLAASSVTHRYYSVDVTNPEAVSEAVSVLEAELGPVTALLHGAGVNVPRLIGSLDAEHFANTLQPKTGGLRNLLQAVDPGRLRLLVTFGSLIARTGMRGEADYATANEWLTRLTDRWCRDHPHCRCLAVEWSVWSGVGMGQRLGRVDALQQQGITPIPPRDGLRHLLDLLRRPAAETSAVVTGRFGDCPTLRFAAPELPFLRFLEQPRAHYPGVELIADSDLSVDSDPYLRDHCYAGQLIVPGVIGLEAMAQAAQALTGLPETPSFEAVEFTRPIVVPRDGHTTLRTAALIAAPGVVQVVVRSSETDFEVDHFSATCRFGAVSGRDEPVFPLVPWDDGSPEIDLEPRSELYGTLLFQGASFQRLERYLHLEARQCLAEVAARPPSGWFGRHLPQILLLGDPGVHDTTLHALQVCVPHRTLIPVAARRVEPVGSGAGSPLRVHAREREHSGDWFVYDVVVVARDGRVVGGWEGLRLRALQGAELPSPRALPLVGPYLERKAEEFAPDAELRVLAHRNGNSSGSPDTDTLFRRLAGDGAVPLRDPAGRPELLQGPHVSAAHAGDLALATCAPVATGCDLEPVTSRPPDLWRDLLGARYFATAEHVSKGTGQDFDRAATLVWCALECLKKSGASADAPMTIRDASPDGWVVFGSGSRIIPATTLSLDGSASPVAVALLGCRREVDLESLNAA